MLTTLNFFVSLRSGVRREDKEKNRQGVILSEGNHSSHMRSVATSDMCRKATVCNIMSERQDSTKGSCRSAFCYRQLLTPILPHLSTHSIISLLPYPSAARKQQI